MAFQVDSGLLNVANSDEVCDLEQRARAIVKAALRSEEKVCIIMFHKATEPQLSDLNDLASNLNNKVFLLAGHLGLMTRVLGELTEQGLKAVEARSERISVETINDDGSVTKTSVFQYGGLRALN